MLQISDLKQEIEELKKGMHSDTVGQALRDVKEYAARASEINSDTLQLKLMHLDEVARRCGHEDREKFSMVLQRFLCHKTHPKIGFLVTSLLSTPEETKMFEKEQKFIKLHSKELAPAPTKVEPKQERKSEVDPMSGMMQFMQMMTNPMFRLPPLQRFSPQPRRTLNGSFRPRLGPVQQLGCHICGDPNHFKIDCPKRK